MSSDIIFFVPDGMPGDKKLDFSTLLALSDRVKAAQEKHPDFADGIYQGVGVIGEEYGELCQAINKGEGEDRVMDEALDLLCVVWRFCRGDWRSER